MGKVDWKWEAEKLLRRYKYLPVEIMGLKSQIQLAKSAGPSITPQYKLRVSSGTPPVASSTENYVFSVEALEKRLKRERTIYETIGYVINSLTGGQRLIYERRYHDEFSVKATMIELDRIIDYRGISEASYYRMQDELLAKVAKLYGMDVPDEEVPEAWRGGLFPPKVLDWS